MLLRLDRASRFTGRVSRAEYWPQQIKSSLTVFGMCLCLLLLIRIIAGPEAVAFGPATQENAPLGVVLLLNLLVYFYLTLPVTARRLQDLGISGHHCRWAFNGLVLTVPCIALSMLGIVFGQAGMTSFSFGAGLFVLAPSLVTILLSPRELPFKKGEPGSNQYGPPPNDANP